MGYNVSDAAHDAHEAEQAAKELDGAVATARTIGQSLEADWRGGDTPLAPEVAVDLSVGAEDQPTVRVHVAPRPAR